MKIKLIIAAVESEPMHKNNPFMPMSLPLLAAAAPDHDYIVIDLLQGGRIDYEEPVDMVGISIRFSTHLRAFEIADRFRKKGVPVIMGGPQASAIPFECIKHADAVAIGEGEVVWPRIIADWQEKKLKNFYVCSPVQFKAEGYSVFQIDHFTDLATLKSPLHHLNHSAYAFETIFASRGCPVGCEFCSVPNLFGRTLRFRPIDAVIRDIANVRKRYFYLIDDSVFGKPGYYDYYIHLYGAMNERLPKKKYWTGQANLDACTDEKGREVVKAAARSGLLYAAVGIESINPLVLQRSGALQKMGGTDYHEVINQMKRSIQFLQNQGIIVSGWFVVGYEEDTIETYYQTLQFCLDMNILPAIFPINAMPGTRLYDRLSAEGRIKESAFFNIRHPMIDDDSVLKALHYISTQGYSFKNKARFHRFYWSRFTSDKIHNSIFLNILMNKFSKGIVVK